MSASRTTVIRYLRSALSLPRVAWLWVPLTRSCVRVWGCCVWLCLLAATLSTHQSTSTWDEAKIYGCVCDSTWPVGFTAGAVQQTQWFGTDCSLKRCPSGNDPFTPEDETDCAFKSANGAVWNGVIGSDGAQYAPGAELPPGVTAATPASGTPGVDTGAPGNKCYVECSNRGTCNYALGVCQCFAGMGGAACEIQKQGLGGLKA